MVLALQRLFPDAPLYTSVYDPDGTYPEFARMDVRPMVLQRLPHRGNQARALLPLYPLAFGALRLRGYDLVVSSSSGWAHAVRPPQGARHVCYCHTPARWLYDSEHYLGPGGPVPPWLQPGLRPVLRTLRDWDQRAAARPHAYIANSATVAGRIASVYGRCATVVHPPVEIDTFRPRSSPERDEPYALVVSRLLPYKRVDLAIAACQALGLRLTVVGGGPGRAQLAQAAGPLVELRSGLSHDQLAELLAGCSALVQAGVEDFGIAPLEANAAGRPAVAFGAGGALETVVDGTTGILFHEQSAAALATALQRVLERRWDPVVLRRHAERFGEERFGRELLNAIAQSFRGHEQVVASRQPDRAGDR